MKPNPFQHYKFRQNRINFYRALRKVTNDLQIAYNSVRSPQIGGTRTADAW
jgi:hypothetical protein